MPLDQVVRIDVGVERTRKLARLAAGEVVDEKISRHAGAAGVEGHAALVPRDRHRRDVGVAQFWQVDRCHRRCLVDAQLGARIVVDADDEVLAVLGKVTVPDVPIGLHDRLARAARQIVADQIIELAVLIGQIVEARPVRAERLRVVEHVTLVGRQVLHLLGLAVVEEDVAVGVGVDLAEGEVAAVRRDVGEVVPLVVLEDHLAGVTVDLVLVHVEEAIVALVRPDEERLVILCPPVERRFESFARRQVGDVTGGILDVDVVELVAAPVAGIEEALVAGEVAHRKDVVFGRLRQLHRLAAIDGKGVSVVDAGLVAADQKLALVGGKGGAAVVHIAEEVLDRVLRHVARGLLVDFGLATRQQGEAQRGDYREERRAFVAKRLRRHRALVVLVRAMMSRSYGKGSISTSRTCKVSAHSGNPRATGAM